MNCDRCSCECIPSEHTTGYGTTKDGERHCFPCCGENDRECLQALPVGGRCTLYLTQNDDQWIVGNWPGTLNVRCSIPRYSFHNFAGQRGRRDVWFRCEGHEFHGVNIGDNDILRVRRIRDKGSR